MKKTIAVIAGDGIGPEIVGEAVKVLKKVAEKFGHDFTFDEKLVGGAAYDAFGDCLPDDTLAACKGADAVLLGAVGGPKWDALPGPKRPEKRALLTLRKELGLFANLRPAKVWSALKDASPLRPDIIGEGLDLLVVRELTGGVYFGEHVRAADGQSALDKMPYSVPEIERIARTAFAAARTRRSHVTCVDKANVLETSRLWREVVQRLRDAEYADVELDFMYVDNAAMQLVRAPSRFDVILTENMFGDILSDEASQITGSIGMLPSASLRADGFGMYEPIHGSAPDIAGRGIANPLATILSAAMLLRHTFGLSAEADAVESAVGAVLARGARTPDIAKSGEKALSTTEMGAAVLAELDR
ncbi:MAG: 3-isopropylmalate dehydrogenase [Kiritimatiellae bacterium]|nr:3-isopropylmalate dehydrogenase [Kiritimatiellia bacterium]